jgi:hypothetical protein
MRGICAICHRISDHSVTPYTAKKDTLKQPVFRAMGGDHKVEKDRWPPYYKQKWGINNLYVAELGAKEAWRLTYTLVAEAGITVLCLEMMNHNDYNKSYGYR